MPVRVGVIGAGWVANDRHLPALRKIRNARITAVFDRHEDRARRAAAKYGATAYYGGLDEFLAGELDAIVVCTPPQSHFEVVSRCLLEGMHVLVEKPFTTSSRDGTALAALSRERDLILSPAHNFLFARSTRRARELVDSGQAGAVISAAGSQRSSWNRRLPAWYEDLPGGLFFDEAPHLLYLMREFVGEMEVATAWRDSRQSPGGARVERTEAQLTGQRGDASLSMTTGAPLSEWYVTLVCEKKILIIDLFRDLLIDLPAESAHNRADVLGVSLRATLQHWIGTMSSGMRVLTGGGDYGHRRLVSQFVDAVDGRGNAPTSAEDGVRNVELMESTIETAGEPGW